MNPIWKDYIVTLSYSAPANGVQWRIIHEGSSTISIIYTGRAFAAPGENQVQVKLNDILADYFEASWLSHDLFQTFNVQAYNTSTQAWEVKANVTFRPDWSYDRDYDPEADGCNFPVQRIVLKGQYLPLSFVGSSIHMLEIISDSGISDFNNDFNADFSIQGTSQSFQNLTGDANGHQHLVTIGNNALSYQIDGMIFKVEEACNRYVLYYINTYGYWDYLIVRGATKRTDDLTRFTASRPYYNALAHTRGKWNYVNEISRKMTFNTEYLTEAQSLLMHHLLNSPTVYVHDLAKNEVLPLCLTGKTTEHKQGGKLYQYIIEAEIGQDFIRR